jgi:hypothetical protein
MAGEARLPPLRASPPTLLLNVAAIVEVWLAKRTKGGMVTVNA